MSKVCLCMIVKDEAKVIERCLRSVLPIIDSWIISDTGSTDGTQDIINKVLQNIPGKLLENVWTDFSTNRNIVLTEARKTYPDYYAYTIDADEVLVIDSADNSFNNLTEDAYLVTYHHGPLIYSRNSLVSLSKDFKYVGVLHEVLHLEGPYNQGKLPDTNYVIYGYDGSRSADPKSIKRMLMSF